MLQVIARHEADLEIPTSVDRTAFLAALAMQESGGGRNWQPNFESAFWEGGAYWNKTLAGYRDRWREKADPEMREWCGKAIACSWGPWQVLYVTAAELGFQGPPWALVDPDLCLEWAITLINKRLAKRLPEGLSGPAIVGLLADGYNSGTFLDTHAPLKYIQAIRAFYSDPSTPQKLQIFV